MQGENCTKRSRFGLLTIAVLLGAVVTMLLAAPASAFHNKNPSRTNQFADAFEEGDNYQGFDPMETSIPYVAWRGEEIRLVKCFDSEYFEPSETGDPFEGGLSTRDPITGLITLLNLEPNETGEWQIMDWSGDAHVWPKFFDDHDQQTQVFFPGEADDQFDDVGDQDGRGCFAIDITSHKPGIAIVKLKVDDEGEGREGGVGDGVQGEGDPVATHQFVVIWMAFQDVRLRDLDADNPLGPITENPRDSNRLGVVVQGRVPLNEEFRTELGEQNDELDADSIILPEAWGALASTSLASISWPLQKANNGIEGDDLYRNPTCDDNVVGTETGVPAFNDNGSLANPDTSACDTDRSDPPFEGTAAEFEYIREPRHTAGDFWDIHDSTGPYNTDVYDSATVNDKPDIDEVCPGEYDGDQEAHIAACHVDQFTDQSIDDYLGNGGDFDCDAVPDDEDGPQGNAGVGPRGLDTVDNCDDGEFDAFSRVFHDVAGEKEGEDLVLGPYSPTRPDETILSDGVLNAHDTPMPAALVIASIAPNQGGNDIGGVGSLVASVDKHQVYNRGGEGCPNPDGSGRPGDGEHCVTGPFSAAYIPPSPTMQNNPAQNIPDPDGSPFETDDDDRDVASGIHGAVANNFNGYLPVYYPERQNLGLYHYWDLVDRLRTAIPTRLPAPCDDFSTPEGDQEIALYTDEHGEAQLTFEAGEGFFAGGFIVDRVQESCRPRDVLGRAEITVNARYPFQPTTSAGATSNRLVKVIESLFDKGIVCVPKPGEEDDKAICIVFARDFAGDPITGERVCVNAEGQTNAAGNVGDVSDLNDEQNSKEDQNEVCVWLDSPELPDPLAELLEDYDGPCDLPDLDDLENYGWEAIVIDGEGALEATADFIEENLEFSCDFSIPPAGATTGASIGSSGGGLAAGGSPAAVANPNSSPATSGTQAGGAPSSQGPLASSQPESKSSPAAKRPAATKRAASLVFVRIVKPLRLGTVRYVVLRVKSPQQQARVQIKLIGKRGKALGTLLRKVKTNRTITVPQLKLPKAVVTVRAKVIA